MTTHLGEIYGRLGDASADAMMVVLPRFALEVIRGKYHHHYYELPKLVSSRDEIESWLDLGEYGMSSPLLLSDLIGRLDTLNGHMAQIEAALYTADDVAIADVLADMEMGGGWSAEDVAALIEALGIIGAAL